VYFYFYFYFTLIDSEYQLNSIFNLREMLIGAPEALVKDTKKGNYIVIIALKTV